MDVGQVGIQPRQHHRRHAAVGFAAVDLHRGAAEHLFAEGFFVFRQALQEGAGRRAPVVAVGERLPQIPYPGTVLQQRFLHLGVHRPFGDVRRHERVAVAVAADPGAEADEARHADRGGAVGVDAVMLAQRLLEKVIRFRHRLEQAFPHVIQAVAHFVAHFQLGAAQLVGAPHHLDLGGQLRFQLALIVHPEGGAVELVADQEHPAHAFHDRAAARFGGMRGEHRRVVQAVDHVLQGADRHALRLEIGQGTVERALPQRHAMRQHAAAVTVGKALLRHVDQLEIAGEPTHHQFHLGGGHGVDHRHQFGAALLVFLLLEFGKAAAQGFHRLEHVFAGELQQHLAEQGAQQLDLRTQVVIRQEGFGCIHGRRAGLLRQSRLFSHIGAHHPTARRALRNIRSHGLAPAIPSGRHDSCAARYTRSGCGIRMLKRPSAVVKPVSPPAEPLGLSG